MRFLHINLHGIKARFLLIGSGLFVLIFIIVGYLALSIESKNIQQRSNESVKAFAELSNKPIVEDYLLYFDSGYFKFSEVFDSIRKLNSYINRVQIISVNGDVVFDSKYFSADQYLTPAVAEKITDDAIVKPDPTYRYSSGRNPQLVEIISPYFNDWQNHSYTVRYFADYYSVEQETASLISYVVVAMLMLVVVAVFLLSFATNRSLIDPLNEVINTAKYISRGDYNKRAEHHSKDEIGNLADSVNQMARTLGQDIIDLKELDKLKDEFVDIAAYNLKVPLNHLKFDIQYLIHKLGGKIDEKSLSLLQDVQANSNKLQLLSEDLINVSAISKNNYSKNIFMPINLSDLLSEVAKEYEGNLKKKKIALDLELPKEATILGDGAKIRQLFLTLLDNAAEYTIKQNTDIKIRLSSKDNNYIVSIKDEGVGIAEEEVGKLFKKFYRAPSSAIYNREGTGLGLYLAKLIVEVHHGNIWVESKQGEGSTFFVSLFKAEIFKKRYTEENR